LSRVDAAPTDVGLSPSAGPVGTTVTVTGTACSPGLIINPSRARVLGVTLGVDADVAVSAGGAWSVQFVVPTDAIVGAHAIAAVCVTDPVPLTYVPLTFTVTAAPASSSTTLAPPTTVATTVASTIAAAAAPPDSGASPDPTPGVASPTTSVDSVATTQAPVATATDPTTTNITQSGPVAVDELVSAARVEPGRRRQPLGFGALSPIGEGWLRWLLSVLLVMLVLSGVFAVAWFYWLRHTRAREWWLRWMHQITDIRSHARPPR
jgi:hypothetical protein